MRQVLDSIAGGERVFIGGGAGEPSALLEAWSLEPDRTQDLSIVTTAIPGINALDLAKFHSSARVTGFMMQSRFGDAQRAGRFRHLPLSYNAIQTWFETSAAFDTCVVQVSAPDERGNCSLGPAVEFFPTLLRRAKRVVALINRQSPRLLGAVAVARENFAAVAEVDTPLASYDGGEGDSVTAAICGHVARYIDDGAALQVGIGKVPAQLLQAISDRRRLRLVTGMYGNGIRALVEKDALDGGFAHRACLALGDRAFYSWLEQVPELRLRGCDETHDISLLANVDGLIAVNSAIEVDLFGQCNLELAAGTAVSGLGGAPDFARAAKVSRGGLSIVALPSSLGRATRIVARLGAPYIVSIPRCDVDLVVTEHGVADLREKSVHERAEALIAIASPDVQSDLLAGWSEIRARL